MPFSSGFRPFQPYESQAVSLRLFEHTLIPGLLQTEAYARAVLETHPNTALDVVEERVAARIARQVILDRDEPPPPMLWVLLDENVLTREVGARKSCTTSSAGWPGARMSVRFDALRTDALTGRASLSLIEKVTEERWTN